MIAVKQNIVKSSWRGRHEPAPLWRRWAALVMGLLALLLFMFVFVPWVQQFPMVRPLAVYIEESGIDAGALFYTEVEETGDAEAFMRDTMRYPPRAR